jgi:hypothetical protein
MGILRHVDSGRTSILEPEHLVGRSSVCSLQLNETYVSAQHAGLRWTGQHWELRDLGSRNGTYLNNAQIRRGEPYELELGAIIGFGQLDQKWELTGAEPPRPMAVPVAGGEPLFLDGDILAIPSADDPQVTIYRASNGLWKVERADEAATTVAPPATFEAAGQLWRFSCPTVLARTETSEQSRQISQIAMRFSVSRDEEHVELEVQCGGQSIDLGSRQHNYVLLTLARQRLGDAERGIPETSCGWIYQDELLKLLATPPTQFNIDVFRIRKQFSALGILDAQDIVERRPRTRQLRIGVPDISIRTV